jgi:hypothetical protein
MRGTTVLVNRARLLQLCGFNSEKRFLLAKRCWLRVPPLRHSPDRGTGTHKAHATTATKKPNNHRSSECICPFPQIAEYLPRKAPARQSDRDNIMRRKPGTERWPYD